MKSWRSRFYVIWIAQAFSLITSELVQFALVWWLTESTGSATVLGIATMIILLPQAIGGPFIGALVDRWDRRLVMIVADFGTAFASLGLVLFFMTGGQNIIFVFLCMLIRAVGQAFHSPAMLASTSLLVPKGHLNQVAGMNQMLGGFVMIVSPLLGALLIKFLPLQSVMLVDVCGALIGGIPLFFTRIPQPGIQKSQYQGFKRVIKDIVEGFTYLRNWPGAINMLLISTSVNFLSRPAFQLVSILTRKHFGGDEGEYAIMAAALGIGLLAGGILMSTWRGFRRRMQTSLCGVVGMGTAILLVGIAPRTSFTLAVCGIFLGGAMMPVCISPIEALVQSSVDVSVQGRVFMLMTSASTLVSPFSLALAGVISDRLSPRFWYVSAGIAIIVIGATGFWNPRVIKLGAFEDPVVQSE